MEIRGFDVRQGHTVAEGLDLIRQSRAPAVRRGGQCASRMATDRRHRRAGAHAAKRARHCADGIWQLLPLAVRAVKLGAVDYLAKPADADDVTDALLAPVNAKAPPPENPMSADRVRWEHIQRVYELCNRNVSETARRLNMHRRTLQRITGQAGTKIARSAPPERSVRVMIASTAAPGSDSACNRAAAVRAKRSNMVRRVLAASLSQVRDGRFRPRSGRQG